MTESKTPEQTRSTDSATMHEGEKTIVEVRERVFLGTGLVWGLIVGVALALAVIILAAQNTGTVNISFLGWDFSTSLIVLTLGLLLIGIVLDELLGVVYRKRRRRTLRDREELKGLR